MVTTYRLWNPRTFSYTRYEATGLWVVRNGTKLYADAGQVDERWMLISRGLSEIRWSRLRSGMSMEAVIQGQGIWRNWLWADSVPTRGGAASS